MRTPGSPGDMTSRGVVAGELPAHYTRAWQALLVWFPRGQRNDPGSPGHVPLALTFTPDGSVDHMVPNPFAPIPPGAKTSCTAWWAVHGRLRVESGDGLWSGQFDVEIRAMDDGRDIITVPAAAQRLGVQWASLGYNTESRPMFASFYAELKDDRAQGDLALQLETAGVPDPVVARWQAQ